MKRVPPPLIGAALAMLFFTGCQMEGSSLTVRSTGGAQGPTGYEVSEAGPELAGLVKIVRAVPRNEQGERVAQPPDLGQEPLNFGQHLGAPGRVEIGYWLDGARPGGMPVDRRAVLVQLRVGQQVGGGIAQPAADDAAQLRGGVVQRLAAHAQGAHAASCRDNEG